MSALQSSGSSSSSLAPCSPLTLEDVVLSLELPFTVDLSFPVQCQILRLVIIVLGQKKEVCFRSPDRPDQNRADPTFFYAILKTFLDFYFLGSIFMFSKNSILGL